MLTCPHCGESIETSPSEQTPWYKHDPGGSTVSLGCGTLILIAIIVAIFSNGGDEADAIRELRQTVESLEQKIDGLSARADARPAE